MPDTVKLDRTIRKAYVIDAAIPNIQSPQHHYREAPEIYKPQRRANRIVVIERGLYSTISINHNRYYPQNNYTTA